ncbi:hypothetical protein IEA35_004577 [Salmonella enterica]|nr:hypothetical protein [Salmonella enterica]
MLNKEYIEEQARNDAALRFEHFQIKKRSDEIFKKMKIDNGYETDDKKVKSAVTEVSPGSSCIGGAVNHITQMKCSISPQSTLDWVYEFISNKGAK